MPTFAELTQRLADLKFRRSILLHLVEHIDEAFRPVAGSEPEKFLLTDDKVKVPAAMFDQVVEDTLLAEVKQIDQQIASITVAAMVQQPPAPQPAPEAASTPPPAAPEPTSRRRRAERV